ncbi:MAG: integral membrane protein MviN [uncultured bacterium]|nr:MAG: integral membrane protein MviN [uncultured bacterium]HBY73368.1 murein biosynthesis integral membrane protein MurJ [Candidatus Kerfeldbacteria bacterium]
MWERLKVLSASVAGGAAILAVASFASRLVGLVRDNLFAKYFGASEILDVYHAAFKVPDFIFNIIVLGALSASFVPVLIERRTQGGEAEANRLASAVMNVVGVGVVVFALVAVWLADPLAHWLMIERSPQQQADTAHLMRIMLVSVVCFGVSNVFAGMLQASRRWLIFSLAPILYNVGIIVGIVWFYDWFGLAGLGYGVVLGALLHLVIQAVAVFTHGFRYQLVWSVPGVQTILRLMPPRAIALGIAQLNIAIIAVLALRLPEGSLAIWTWADNLQHVPINMVGVSLALSAFPVFAQALAEQDTAKFRKVFSENFRRLLFLIIPVSVAILLLRAQLVRIILGSFGSGAFDWDATVITAQVLGIFAVALFAQASIPLLARSFFAHHDTRTTLFVSVGSLVLNVVLAYGLMDYLGLYGLAFAFSISSLVNMLLLLLFLRIKFGDLDDATIIRSIWRIIIASIALGLIIHGMKYFVANFVDMHTFIGIFIQTAASVAAGGLVYLGIAYYFNFPELQIVKQQLAKLRTYL